MILESKNCKAGKEQYLYYTSRTTGKECLQYDYRDKSGKLHSTVVSLQPEHSRLLSDSEGLEIARKKCNFGT